MRLRLQMEIYDYTKNKILLSLPNQKKKAGEEGKKALFAALKQSYDKTRSLLVKSEDLEGKAEDKYELNLKAIVATGKYGMESPSKTPKSSRQLTFSPREMVLKSPTPPTADRGQQGEINIDHVALTEISDKVFDAVQRDRAHGKFGVKEAKTFKKKVDVFSPTKKRTNGWREKYSGNNTGLIEGVGSVLFTSPINNKGLVVRI